MSELRKYLIDELTGSKSGIEQARSWLVQHPQDAAAAVDLLVHDLKTVTSHSRCLNVLYAPPGTNSKQCASFLDFKRGLRFYFFVLRYLINDVVHYCKRKEGDAVLASLAAQFEVGEPPPLFRHCEHNHYDPPSSYPRAA